MKNLVDACGSCGSSSVVLLVYANCSELFCRRCRLITKIKAAELNGVKSLPDYCFKSRC